MPVIEAVGLAKAFTTGAGEVVRALDDLSVTVESGEFVAIVGPSGSGKSTLLYALCGLENVDSGRVRLAGTDLGDLSEDGRAAVRREKVGFLTQRYNLVPYLNVQENAELTLRLAGRRPDASETSRLLETLGVGSEAKRMPDELSGGQQQRVALARALLTHPEVILADEPTGALDSRTGEGLVELLRERAQSGSAVLMATHNLQNASMADRVLVMRDGRLAASLNQPDDRSILAALDAQSGL